MVNNQQTPSCNHTSFYERGWHCTLNSVDLESALEAGYYVPRCYSIYDWGAFHTRDDLFKEMIQVISLLLI